MRLDKVIVKSVLSTLAAIGFLCLLLGSVLCVVFPQTMMGITHDMGMSGLSMHFAEVAYKRTDETYYVAFATQTAITKKDAGKTEEFGEMFLTDEGFEKYAEKFVNDSANFDTVAEYRISIQNAVCAAEYNQGKKDEAINDAFNYMGNTFPLVNPVIEVAVAADEKKDVATLTKIKERLEGLEVPDEDKDYKGVFIAKLEEAISKISS